MSGGHVTVQGWVYLFLGLSVLSLIAASVSTRSAIEATAVFFKRRRKTAAALVGLLIPVFAPALSFAQTEHSGGAKPTWYCRTCRLSVSSA